jgi:hypothetical protein
MEADTEALGRQRRVKARQNIKKLLLVTVPTSILQNLTGQSSGNKRIYILLF